MSIKITVEKYVNSKGLAKAKIVSVEGMQSKTTLPSEYLDNEPMAYQEARCIKSSVGYPDCWIEAEYNYDEIIKCIEGIKPAGKRLREINLKIAELKQTWTAKEIHYI